MHFSSNPIVAPQPSHPSTSLLCTIASRTQSSLNIFQNYVNLYLSFIFCICLSNKRKKNSNISNVQRHLYFIYSATNRKQFNQRPWPVLSVTALALVVAVVALALLLFPVACAAGTSFLPFFSEPVEVGIRGGVAGIRESSAPSRTTVAPPYTATCGNTTLTDPNKRSFLGAANGAGGWSPNRTIRIGFINPLTGLAGGSSVFFHHMLAGARVALHAANQCLNSSNPNRTVCGPLLGTYYPGGVDLVVRDNQGQIAHHLQHLQELIARGDGGSNGNDVNSTSQQQSSPVVALLPVALDRVLLASSALLGQAGLTMVGPQPRSGGLRQLLPPNTPLQPWMDARPPQVPSSSGAAARSPFVAVPPYRQQFVYLTPPVEHLSLTMLKYVIQTRRIRRLGFMVGVNLARDVRLRNSPNYIEYERLARQAKRLGAQVVAVFIADEPDDSFPHVAQMAAFTQARPQAVLMLAFPVPSTLLFLITALGVFGPTFLVAASDNIGASVAAALAGMPLGQAKRRIVIGTPLPLSTDTRYEAIRQMRAEVRRFPDPNIPISFGQTGNFFMIGWLHTKFILSVLEEIATRFHNSAPDRPAQLNITRHTFSEFFSGNRGTDAAAVGAALPSSGGPRFVRVHDLSFGPFNGPCPVQQPAPMLCGCNEGGHVSEISLFADSGLVEAFLPGEVPAEDVRVVVPPGQCANSALALRTPLYVAAMLVAPPGNNPTITSFPAPTGQGWGWHVPSVSCTTTTTASRGDSNSEPSFDASMDVGRPQTASDTATAVVCRDVSGSSFLGGLREAAVATAATPPLSLEVFTALAAHHFTLTSVLGTLAHATLRHDSSPSVLAQRPLVLVDGSGGRWNGRPATAAEVLAGSAAPFAVATTAAGQRQAVRRAMLDEHPLDVVLMMVEMPAGYDTATLSTTAANRTQPQSPNSPPAQRPPMAVPYSTLRRDITKMAAALEAMCGGVMYLEPVPAIPLVRAGRDIPGLPPHHTDRFDPCTVRFTATPEQELHTVAAFAASTTSAVASTPRGPSQARLLYVASFVAEGLAGSVANAVAASSAFAARAAAVRDLPFSAVTHITQSLAQALDALPKNTIEGVVYVAGISGQRDVDAVFTFLQANPRAEVVLPFAHAVLWYDALHAAARQRLGRLQSAITAIGADTVAGTTISTNTDAVFRLLIVTSVGPWNTTSAATANNDLGGQTRRFVNPAAHLAELAVQFLAFVTGAVGGLNPEAPMAAGDVLARLYQLGAVSPLAAGPYSMAPCGPGDDTLPRPTTPPPNEPSRGENGPPPPGNDRICELSSGAQRVHIIPFIVADGLVPSTISDDGVNGGAALFTELFATSRSGFPAHDGDSMTADDGQTVGLAVGLSLSLFAMTALLVGGIARFYCVHVRPLLCAPKDPSKPYTIVVTDVQSSTALWACAPAAMALAVPRHHALVRRCIRQHNGYEVKTLGDGFMIAFSTAGDATLFAAALQLALREDTFLLVKKVPHGASLHPHDDPAGGAVHDPRRRHRRRREQGTKSAASVIEAVYEEQSKKSADRMENDDEEEDEEAETETEMTVAREVDGSFSNTCRHGSMRGAETVQFAGLNSTTDAGNVEYSDRSSDRDAGGEVIDSPSSPSAAAAIAMDTRRQTMASIASPSSSTMPSSPSTIQKNVQAAASRLEGSRAKSSSSSTSSSLLSPSSGVRRRQRAVVIVETPEQAAQRKRRRRVVAKGERERIRRLNDEWRCIVAGSGVPAVVGRGNKKEADVGDEPQQPPNPSPWRGLRVRIGIHTGTGGTISVNETSGRYDYSGPITGGAAAVAALAHGGQTLLSPDTFRALTAYDTRATHRLIAPSRERIHAEHLAHLQAVFRALEEAKDDDRCHGDEEDEDESVAARRHFRRSARKRGSSSSSSRAGGVVSAIRTTADRARHSVSRRLSAWFRSTYGPRPSGASSGSNNVFTPLYASPEQLISSSLAHLSISSLSPAALDASQRTELFGASESSASNSQDLIVVQLDPVPWRVFPGCVTQTPPQTLPTHARAVVPPSARRSLGNEEPRDDDVVKNSGHGGRKYAYDEPDGPIDSLLPDALHALLAPTDVLAKAVTGDKEIDTCRIAAPRTPPEWLNISASDNPRRQRPAASSLSSVGGAAADATDAVSQFMRSDAPSALHACPGRPFHPTVAPSSWAASDACMEGVDTLPLGHSASFPGPGLPSVWGDPAMVSIGTSISAQSLSDPSPLCRKRSSQVVLLVRGNTQRPSAGPDTATPAQSPAAGATPPHSGNENLTGSGNNDNGSNAMSGLVWARAQRTSSNTIKDDPVASPLLLSPDVATLLSSASTRHSLGDNAPQPPDGQDQHRLERPRSPPSIASVSSLVRGAARATARRTSLLPAPTVVGMESEGGFRTNTTPAPKPLQPLLAPRRPAKATETLLRTVLSALPRGKCRALLRDLCRVWGVPLNNVKNDTSERGCGTESTSSHHGQRQHSHHHGCVTRERGACTTSSSSSSGSCDDEGSEEKEETTSKNEAEESPLFHRLSVRLTPIIAARTAALGGEPDGPEPE